MMNSWLLHMQCRTVRHHLVLNWYVYIYIYSPDDHATYLQDFTMWKTMQNFNSIHIDTHDCTDE